MSMIEKILKSGQNVSLTINVMDLKEVFKEIIAEYNDEQRIKAEQQEKAETYLTAQETATALKCSIPTLCRWHKSKYLVPLKVGRMVRYKQSDIDRILKGGIYENKK